MAWFLKMDTIPGESHQHKDFMDVLHWQTGADLPVTSDGATGGLRKGESNIHDLNVTVQADKAAVELRKACLGGRHIPNTILEGYKDANGKPELYYKATYKDGLISNVNYGTGEANQMSPVSFSLKFNEVEEEYKEIDKTGKTKGSVKMKFNAGTHKVS
jgi:type VI secretion system Hcp family effector